MDPFTERMLAKAEQRSRALGISNIDASATAGIAVVPHKPQFLEPLQVGSTATFSGVNGGLSQMQVVEKTQPIDAASMDASGDTPTKVLRQFTAVDKENVDLGIEINITTDKNIEVQVQVEEQDITYDEQQRPQLPPRRPGPGDFVNQPLAKIRDQSRDRLQRLGTLYSNTVDLSSPIHRTEGQFHAGTTDDLENTPCKPRHRYGKLVALADTINQWEDDTTHHVVQSSIPPPKPDLPSRRMADVDMKYPAPPPPLTAAAKTSRTATDNGVSNKIKQLKWDPKVITSLEAQGFQRRESSTVKYAYEYDKVDERKGETTAQRPVYEKSTNTLKSADAKQEKKLPTVKAGLVSDRAAVFENKASAAELTTQRQQKDPTELSLRERMQLFEKHKGEALVPKAAFGMAPSISKIRQETNASKIDEKITAPTSTMALVKSCADSKVRDKVAALVASAATMSENKINADINRQRQEEMQMLANRFHKPKEATPQQGPTNTDHRLPKGNFTATRLPPPPPPLPSKVADPILTATTKRRSPGDAIDDAEEEESKRAKKTSIMAATQRLYPTLSDFGSQNSSDNEVNCATTATASGRSTADIERQRAPGWSGAGDGPDQENDSSMASEADDDSSADIGSGNLGREIMQVVEHNERQQNVKQPKEVRYAEKNVYYTDCAAAADYSLNSSEGSMGVDDYLDEALDGPFDHDGDDDDTQQSDDECEENSSARGCQGTTTSNSFSFRKTPRKYPNYQAIHEEQSDYHTPIARQVTGGSPVRSELCVNREDDNMVTLVHTVSFYRRQQNANSVNSTPVRKVCREQQLQHSAKDHVVQSDEWSEQQSSTPRNTSIDEATEDDDEQSQAEAEVGDTQLVQERIKRLLDEVCKQQQVIGQTSQALNLCAATIEFSGSTESVEGERHLLVATHRRQACLDEVQRLRVEKSLRPLGAPREKGRLTVQDITVPLRQDYIRKLAADTISGHHLVCLLKYNEHVLATKTVPTLPGLLAVKFPDALILNNVYADFRITLEIYGMTAQREVLPHEVKYHINLNKKTGIRTPKKKAGPDNRLFMPPVQSPAGPSAVRTPALVQYGYAIFSLREIQRTSWSLAQVLGVSPLDGTVHMKVNCELCVSVEHKGFLTMFEDISGFGAWHRRWCCLNGSVLSYWKYPDDERKKAPLGSVDLYACSSQKVALAPRDICARLNTLLLESKRPSRDSDRESLIIVPNGSSTIVRLLLSADTREERDEWCAHLNKALTLLRAWGSTQQ